MTGTPQTSGGATRLRSAIRWSFVMNWGSSGASFLVTLVLAAIVGPRAFGIVAMTAVYIAFIGMLLEQGLSEALIQKRDLEDEHLDSAFWMVMVAGSALTIGSLACSGWWSEVNQLPEVSRVINVLSLLIPIEALTIVQRAVLSREMNFKKLAIRANGSVLIGGIVGIALALKEFGVWALVAQRLVSAATALALLWSMGRWRPKLRFSRRHARDLFGFSTLTFLRACAVFVGQRADVMIIGLFFGPTAAGIYRVADRIRAAATEFTIRPFISVALPHFSRLQAERGRLRNGVLLSMRGSGTLAIPVMAVIASSSDQLMAAVGPQWVAGADALEILCILGATTVLTTFAVPLMQALGRPLMAALLACIITVITLVLLASAGLLLKGAPVETQAVGMALARLAVLAAFSMPVIAFLLHHLIGLTLLDLGRNLVPATLAGMCAWFASWAATPSASTNLPPMVSLAIVVASGSLAAAVALLVLDRRLRGEALRWLEARYRQSRLAGEEDPR